MDGATSSNYLNLIRSELLGYSPEAPSCRAAELTRAPAGYCSHKELLRV